MVLFIGIIVFNCAPFEVAGCSPASGCLEVLLEVYPLICLVETVC